LRGHVVYEKKRREEKTDAKLIPMDARQQRMWELRVLWFGTRN
jgi:hypothetical protein